MYKISLLLNAGGRSTTPAFQNKPVVERQHTETEDHLHNTRVVTFIYDGKRSRNGVVSQWGGGWQRLLCSWCRSGTMVGTGTHGSVRTIG